MLGTIVNVSAILTGSVIGSFLTKGVNERYKTALFDGLGLATVGLGGNAFVSNMPKTTYPVLFIASIAIGTVIGTWLDIDGRFHKLLASAKGGSKLAEGLSTAILLFCIGTLSILGPIESRLNGNNTYLFTNATLDFVSSIILGSAYGMGIALAALVLISTCYYTVDDKQQAVVTTFGKVTDITDAGVHLKLPFGIQKVEKVDVNVYQKITLGYDPVGISGYNVNDRDSAMITGDYNIVNVDFFVEYKISDPVQYLYSSNEPELILRNLIQSQIRNVVGSSSVDAVLTDGKESIQMQVKELVTEILKEYDIGLTLVDVKIQDAEPPTQEVIEAFKAVETAKQQAETVINDAKAYQNAQLPQAQAALVGASPDSTVEELIKYALKRLG